MAGQLDSCKNFLVNKNGIKKVSPYIQKASITEEDFNDDIAIVGENVKENSSTRKKTFISKKIYQPVIQILDDSSEDELPDEYANVCGVNVNIKTLLENEEIRKHLEPFVEKENVEISENESETEEVEIFIPKNLLELNGLDKRLLICKPSQQIISSSGSSIIKQFTVDSFEQLNNVEEVEILLSDSSDDDCSPGVNKKNVKSPVMRPEKQLQQQKLNIISNEELKSDNPISVKILQASSMLPLKKRQRKTSHVVMQDEEEILLTKKSSPKQMKTPEKKMSVNTLECGEPLETNDEIFEDLCNVDLSSEAKILSFVDKLCETDDLPEENIPVIEIESNFNKNSTTTETDDWFYLNMSDKKKESPKKNMDSVDEALSKSIKRSPHNNNPKSRKNISSLSQKNIEMSDKFPSKENSELKKKTSLSKEIMEKKGIDILSKDDTRSEDNDQSLTTKKELKKNPILSSEFGESPSLNEELNRSSTSFGEMNENPILKLTDDILPVETVAPKRRGRKRKNEEIDTYGKICIQKNILKKNFKTKALPIDQTLLNDQIQDTLSETIKSFFSVDQLHPIKQEIQESNVKEPEENPVSDEQVDKEDVNAENSEALGDANGLLSVLRKESVEDFYKSKNTQRKKRKRKGKRSRLVRYKYANIERSQWLFLPRQPKSKIKPDSNQVKKQVDEKNRSKVLQQSDKENKTGQCQNCGKRYEKLACLKTHQLTCYTSTIKKNLKCAICSFKTEHENDFQSHLATHIYENSVLDTKSQVPQSKAIERSSQKNFRVVRPRLCKNKALQMVSDSIKNKKIARKIRKRKLKFINRKKLEMRKRELRSIYNHHISEIQISESLRSETNSTFEMPDTKLLTTNLTRQGLKARKQFIYESKNPQYSDRFISMHSTTRRYSRSSMNSSFSNREFEASEPKVLVLSGKRYLVRNRKNTGITPRIGVLNFCNTHCATCDIDSYAERNVTYCVLCRLPLTYWCALCERRFHNFWSVRAHVISNVRSWPSSSQCSKCFRAYFTSRCSFKKHQRNCTSKFIFDKELSVNIERCDLQLKHAEDQRKALTVHCTNCNITKYVSKEETKCDECQSPVHYKCEICGELVESNSAFRDHILNAHIIGYDTYRYEETDEFDENDEEKDDRDRDEECNNKENIFNTNSIKEIETITGQHPLSNDLEINNCDYNVISLKVKPITDNKSVESIKESMILDKTAKNEFEENANSIKKLPEIFLENYNDDSDEESIVNDQIVDEIQISSSELLDIIGISKVSTETSDENFIVKEQNLEKNDSILKRLLPPSLNENNSFMRFDDDSTDSDRFNDDNDLILRDLSEDDSVDNNNSNKNNCVNEHNMDSEETCSTGLDQAIKINDCQKKDERLKIITNSPLKKISETYLLTNDNDQFTKKNQSTGEILLEQNNQENLISAHTDINFRLGGNHMDKLYQSLSDISKPSLIKKSTIADVLNKSDVIDEIPDHSSLKALLKNDSTKTDQSINDELVEKKSNSYEDAAVEKNDFSKSDECETENKQRTEDVIDSKKKISQTFDKDKSSTGFSKLSIVKKNSLLSTDDASNKSDEIDKILCNTDHSTINVELVEKKSNSYEETTVEKDDDFSKSDECEAENKECTEDVIDSKKKILQTSFEYDYSKKESEELIASS